MQVIRNIFLWVLLLLPLSTLAQNEVSEADADAMRSEIESRMMEYVDELMQLSLVSDMQIRFSDASPLSLSYVEVLNDKMKQLNDKYQNIEFRWQNFIQAMQMDIANDAQLMEVMSKVQQMKQVVADTIAAKQQKCDALSDFARAEDFIQNQDEPYQALYKKAFELSLWNKLEPKLEKEKAKEQMLFGQIQEHYAKAQKATELVPELSKRMVILEEHYANVQVMSKKIQELTYKPLMQRLKDYLISFACVAVLLLFVNMVMSKYKALKAARKQLKEYEEMMKKNNGGPTTPTI